MANKPKKESENPLDIMVDERIIIWSGISGKEYKYWIAPIGASFKPVAGNYIFAKETSPNTWTAIYVGETENLAERLNNPNDDENSKCVRRYGGTHIHSHTGVDDSDIRQKEETDIVNKSNPPCNFERIFEILRKQLLDASSHFYIWEQLWPTEKVVGIINRYIGFFQPTRYAHLDRLIIKVSDILSKKPNAPSFYRISNMVGRNPNLAPAIDVRDIKKRLRKHKEVLEAIKDYRDKRVAHWDTSVEKLDKPVLLGRTKRMLKELEAIFNEISASHSNNVWSFKYSQQGNTISLLEALKEKLTQDQKRIEYLEKQNQLENEGLNCCE